MHEGFLQSRSSTEPSLQFCSSELSCDWLKDNQMIGNFFVLSDNGTTERNQDVLDLAGH